MRLVAVTLGLGVLAAASPVAANGRPPNSSTLTTRVGDPDHALIGATFGLLFSPDAGETWNWMCEDAANYGGAYDPDYVVLADGSVIATTYDGLQIMRDGCTFNPSSLGAIFISKLTRGGDGAIHAAAAYGMGPGIPIDSQLYVSRDDGVTFTPGMNVAASWWDSVVVAPSDPQRVYLAGYRLLGGGDREFVLARSNDGGATGAELVHTGLTLNGRSKLLIAGVDPTDPNRLFARVTFHNGVSLSDAIYRSTDGGTTWTFLIEVDDNATGFLIRDGVIWLGQHIQGILRSTDGGDTFTAVPDSPGINAFLPRPDGSLWAIADQAISGATFLTSPDGLSWTPMLRFSQIDAPVDCPAGTIQRDVCIEQTWCGLRSQLGITATVIDCTVPDAAPSGNDASPPSGSCCDTGGAPHTSALATLGLAAWLIRPRRRRRR